MNCYNHIDQPAVGTCIDCGKGLCNECAHKYTDPICDSCNLKRIRKEKSEMIKRWAGKGEYYTKNLAILLPLIALFLITIELILRAIYDKPANYFKSAYQTLRLIQFLRQDENSQLAFSIDNSSTVTRFNPILRKFNRATSKCVVDVRKESVTIVIKYPKTQQAQKLLRNMESYIKEEISSRNPEYYFSAPNRRGNKLWFKSTKR